MSILKKNYSVDELLDRSLVKWPQMLLTGDSVTPEQALEIIRRTDTFFICNRTGNNHDFIRDLKQKISMPLEPKGLGEEYIEYEDHLESWRMNWNCIKTEYVRNSWIACANLLGPHGWCHPDGKLGYEDNIGKSPSCREVYSDLIALADAFPFLQNVGVTIMDAAASDIDSEFGTNPVISFHLHKGVVNVVDPNKHDVHDAHDFVPHYRGPDKNRIRECDLTHDQIDQMIKK